MSTSARTSKSDKIFFTLLVSFIAASAIYGLFNCDQRIGDPFKFLQSHKLLMIPIFALLGMIVDTRLPERHQRKSFQFFEECERLAASLKEISLALILFCMIGFPIFFVFNMLYAVSVHVSHLFR